MIQMTLTVTLGDQTMVANTNGWTIIQWERKTKQKYSAVASAGLGFEDLYLLAHIALRDNGHIVPDFDRFCKEVQSIEVDVEDPNPIHGGVTATQSQ